MAQANRRRTSYVVPKKVAGRHWVARYILTDIMRMALEAQFSPPGHLLIPSCNHERLTMRTPQLSALVFAMLTFSAVAAEPQKLWEASGFKQPESVVFDRASGAIYVSNVNGDPMKKDGNGFISKLGPDGKVVTMEWVKGLDSPTGLAL